jgi:hypothetical protein
VRRAVGALALVTVLVSGCGGDDEAQDQAQVCERAEELDAARAAIPTAQPSSQADIDEAKARILAMIDALQALLASVPPELEADASEVAATTDDIEQRIQDAEGAELFLEVPSLLSQIADEQAGPFSRILAHVEQTCG